jgi:hypothetical protein
MLRGILRLAFDDARPGEQPPETGQAFGLMTEPDARSIWEFVFGLRGDDTLIVQCEAGWSRSAAVAAAIAHVLDDDAERFFRDRSPNAHVFRMMLRNVWVVSGVNEKATVFGDEERRRKKGCLKTRAYPYPPFLNLPPLMGTQKEDSPAGVIFPSPGTGQSP